MDQDFFSTLDGEYCSAENWNHDFETLPHGHIGRCNPLIQVTCYQDNVGDGLRNLEDMTKSHFSHALMSSGLPGNEEVESRISTEHKTCDNKNTGVLSEVIPDYSCLDNQMLTHLAGEFCEKLHHPENYFDGFVNNATCQTEKFSQKIPVKVTIEVPDSPEDQWKKEFSLDNCSEYKSPKTIIKKSQKCIRTVRDIQRVTSSEEPIPTRKRRHHASSYFGKQPRTGDCDGQNLSDKLGEKDHLQTVTSGALGIKLLFCNLCGKKYKTKYHLDQHIQIHEGKKNFVCKICKKAFPVKGHLSNHISVSGKCRKKFKPLGQPGTGVKDKSYVVCECQREFASPNDLYNHLRSSGHRSTENICIPTT